MAQNKDTTDYEKLLYGAQAAEERKGYLSGTRERRFDTRLGTINLEIPTDKSYIRLVTAYLIKYTENWLEGSCYVKADLLKQQNEGLAKAA